MHQLSHVRMSSRSAREASRVTPVLFWMLMEPPGNKYFRAEHYSFDHFLFNNFPFQLSLLLSKSVITICIQYFYESVGIMNTQRVTRFWQTCSIFTSKEQNALRALSWQIVTIWMRQTTRDTSTQSKPWIEEQAYFIHQIWAEQPIKCSDSTFFK